MSDTVLLTRSAPHASSIRTFTIGIDGSQETELTDVNSCCGSWSPDGTIIVVPDAVGASRVVPATLNADGTSYAVHSIGPPTLSLGPAGWSPDGNKIAFEGWDDTDPTRTGLYVSEGSTLGDAAPVQITQAPVHDIPLGWSPDGARMLLIQGTRCPEGDCDGGDLYVVDSDGSDLIRLNPEGTFVSCCGPASWSPDGTQVAFGAPTLDAAGKADEVAGDVEQRSGIGLVGLVVTKCGFKPGLSLTGAGPAVRGQVGQLAEHLNCGARSCGQRGKER